MSWSDLLNKPPAVHVSPYGTTSVNIKEPIFYNIDCQILVNPVTLGDTLHIISVTLLDISNSYYFISRAAKASLFINLTFDLYENTRRVIMEKCSRLAGNRKLSYSDVQSIYINELKQLKDTIKRFHDETHNGTYPPGLQKWTNYLHDKTGTDHSALLQRALSEKP